MSPVRFPRPDRSGGDRAASALSRHVRRLVHDQTLERDKPESNSVGSNCPASAEKSDSAMWVNRTSSTRAQNVSTGGELFGPCDQLTEPRGDGSRIGARLGFIRESP